jgi:hypothetical protein
MVCDGQIDIATAQAAFVTDWIAAYHTYCEAMKKRVAFHVHRKLTLSTQPVGHHLGGRLDRRDVVKSMSLIDGTSVWSGRALQVVSPSWR